MNIAQISKADSFGGGASRVAEDLCNLLIHDNYGCTHWTSWSGKGYNTTRSPLYGRFEHRVRQAHYIVKKMGFPELVPFELITLMRRNRMADYDLFHFHDLSSAISPFTLRYISQLGPVIWTIHDCSPFTGGCLYPMSCERFKTGCGNCPQIGEWPIDSRFDNTALLYGIKRALHKTGRVVAISPSQWMADQAFSSGILKTKPAVIHNGVDVETYQFADKDEVRDRLGLPKDRRIVLISAGNVLDERKGTRFALEALSRAQELKPFLLVVGAVDNDAKQLLAPFDYHATGYLNSPSDLAPVYSAADIFLFCSLADNQPLVILETMAAGTPLIGFATGGIPEMVEQDKTGFLVKPRDVESLTQAIKYAFSDNRCARWSRAGRHKAVNEFSNHLMLKKHIGLYEAVIAEKDRAWLK